MYKITAKFPSGNDLVLYDPVGTGALPILDPKQTEELNQPGSLTFTLLYSHGAYGLLDGMKVYISAEKEGEEIFYGRVLDVEPDELLGQETITCEGALSFLNDGFLAPDPKNNRGESQHQTMTAEAFFNRCIDEYNDDIDNDPRRIFHVGTVSHSRKNETRTYQITQFTSAKEAIEQNILNNYGGFLKVYRDGFDRLMIDWVDDYGVVDSGLIELGENVISQSNRLSGENMFTAIRPIGKDGLVHSTTPVIDIYIQEEMAEYGRIVKNVDFPGITNQADLLAAGQALAQRINKTIYISSEISLLDLHFVDEDEPEVKLGNRYTNISGLEDFELTVSVRNRDYNNPQNDSISLKNDKHLEGNGIDDFRNDGDTISKRTSGSSNGVGMALKYYHELQDEAAIYAQKVNITAEKLLELHADELILSGNNLETLSRRTQTVEGKVTTIEGTGVYQNSDHITQVAGNFTVERDDQGQIIGINVIEGAKFSVEKDGVYSEVVGQNGMNSAIAQSASQIRLEVENSISAVRASIEITEDSIRSDVESANSRIYTAIEQTASAIRSTIADTEDGLYNYIQNTASGTRQVIINTTNRTWIQDTDPRTESGGSHDVKVGDIWVESTHQGSWDGAEGFNWEHDEGYDWTQIQGAKIWGWQNGKWELISDQQQVVSYSDVIDTAEHYVNLKIAGVVNDEGLLDVYMSKIEQTATDIRSEISNADSTIYSFIHQTQSNILLRVAEKPRTVYSKSQPTTIDGRALKNDDVWIETEGKENWDALFNDSWGDETGIDWNALRSDKIKVYKDGHWVEIIDGTKLVDDADLEVEKNTVKMYARKLEQVNGELQQYYAELKVDAHQIRSEVTEKYNGLGSRITQTATQIKSEVYDIRNGLSSSITQTASQIRLEVRNSISGVNSSITQTANSIRSEVNAANSRVYSSITQTASQIRSEVANSISSVRSSITQTANQIRSEVNAANSKVYSSITQTASQIRSEVASSISSVRSSITQTANQIRSEVNAANSKVYSSITQTASQIRSEVANDISGVRSSITQQANKIALVVDGNKVNAAKIAAAINAQTGTSKVLISADIIDLDGDTIASRLVGTDVEVEDFSADVVSISEAINFPSQLDFKMGSWWLYANGAIYGNMSDVLVKAELSSDEKTLILTRMDGTKVNFSKATTLSPSWSGSTLTMAAQQTNNGVTSVVASKTLGFGGSYGSHDIELGLTQNGYPTRNSATQISVPIKIVQQQGGGATTDRYSATLNYSVSSILQEKSVSSNGDVTPDSGYIGLSKVTVSGVHSTQFTLRCTAKTPVYPGSNINNYTFTLQSAYSFNTNTNYYFYR